MPFQLTKFTELQQAKHLVSEGINPTQYRKEQRKAAQAKREADTLTFKKIARQWHEERLNAGKWKESHAAKIIKSLENDAFPMIGNLPIIQIDAPLLLKVLQPIVERGVIETSRKINHNPHLTPEQIQIASNKTHRDRLKTCNTLLERSYSSPTATPETLGILERFIAKEISAVQAGLLVEAHGLIVPPLLNKYIDNALKIFKANSPVGLFEAERKLPLL